MYGVESFVHPDYQSHGIGGKLMEARFAVARRRNLRGMLAGSLPIDYYKVADRMSIEQYVRDVVAGKRFDTNLSKQLRKGFKVGPVIRDYAASWGSLDWGVTILWENPDYRPVRNVWPVRAMPAPQSLSPVRHQA
jgi:GNAT superfamily N-acetyltransferase